MPGQTACLTVEANFHSKAGHESEPPEISDRQSLVRSAPTSNCGFLAMMPTCCALYAKADVVYLVCVVSRCGEDHDRSTHKASQEGRKAIEFKSYDDAGDVIAAASFQGL